MPQKMSQSHASAAPGQYQLPPPAAHREFYQDYLPLIFTVLMGDIEGYFIQNVQDMEVGSTQKPMLRVQLGGNVDVSWFLSLEEPAWS